MFGLAVAGCPWGCRPTPEKRPGGSGAAGKPARDSGGPKEHGGSGGGYLETVVRSKKMADTLADKAQLRAIWQELRMYAIGRGGKFPDSLEDLGRSAYLKAPGSDGQPYRYVPGQLDTHPAGNVLVYEETPAHRGNVLVLRLGGSVELLTPEQLEQALEETKRKLGQ